ncbi:MAG: prepilin-type N-terminal cleavage/methylation domain-containing protein [Nitrospiraceae bacterium]|nr:prepilin-type N-terminal cleavage/methylation domain-containing protein [Nitrospiraceae bacterium]
MNGRGFTLIEIIVTIVIVAILASMLYSYFGPAITGSGVPVARLESAMAAQSAMENVTADYMANYQTNLSGLQTNIGREGSALNASYGSGTVIDNHFITWSGNAEAPAAISNCLKVTIRDGAGWVLTQIYTSGSQGTDCQ